MAKSTGTKRRDVEADAEEAAADLSGKLKEFGVDTEVMAEAAKEQAADLKKLLEEELRERPLRTLGLAVAAGAFLGLLVSR
jgi:ElaB/YqjD/DUF883 family membrane-anchored ribosome-binding protein